MLAVVNLTTGIVEKFVDHGAVTLSTDGTVASGQGQFLDKDGEEVVCPVYFEAPKGYRFVSIDSGNINSVAEGGSWSQKKGFTLPQPDLPTLAPTLVLASEVVCSNITTQVVPDSTHQQAYDKAAMMVVAGGGKAPSADPYKTVFNALGSSVGISDPDTFASVVTAITLSALKLGTIQAAFRNSVLSTLKLADVQAAVTTFNAAIEEFVSELNTSGLTLTVQAPTPLSAPGM